MSNMQVCLEKPSHTFNPNLTSNVDVNSIEEARDLFIQVRDFYDMGASSYEYRNTGEVLVDGVVVFQISYNGRVWNKDGTEYLPNIQKNIGVEYVAR